MEQTRVKQQLKKHFGFDSFRPQQAEIVNALLSGQDTLALLATGGGKSLCFQLPATLLPGLTVVISPLISLMSDQVKQLKKKKIAAAFLASSLAKDEYESVLKKVENQQLVLLYVSPEALLSEKISSLLLKQCISLLVVDEAHCISQWGHDFRPHYTRICEFREKYERKWGRRVAVAAFTATATPKVEQDIITYLKLHKPVRFFSTYERTNLSSLVKKCQKKEYKEQWLIYFLRQKLPKAGIIYCSTQKSTEYIASLINYYFGEEICQAYHAGLAPEQRACIQDRFLQNESNCIAATNAFGMGVDKSNIRWVVHFELPGSIEAYFQEVGRAGRDGQKAQCLLLTTERDLIIHQHFMQKSTPQQLERQQHLLRAMIEYVDYNKCKHQYILDYFNELKCLKSCAGCSSCHPQKMNSNAIDATFYYYLEMREQICQQYQIPKQLFATTNQLRWLAINQPKNRIEYSKIPGIGTGWLDKWYNTHHVHDYQATH